MVVSEVKGLIDVEFFVRVLVFLLRVFFDLFRGLVVCCLFFLIS